MTKRLSLPNADDPVLRRINGLRTLLDVLGEVPPGERKDSGRSNGEITRSEGSQPRPSFERMMAVVNRRKGRG